MEMGALSIKRTIGSLAILIRSETFEIISHQTSHSLMMLTMLEHVSTSSETIVAVFMQAMIVGHL